MILRDPVHGLVAFDRPEHALVRALLDTREVQRLRRIRQLGVASLAFPGAEHSRFQHALGACHVMARLLDHLGASEGAVLRSGAREDALVAALLHDVGHGPYSHLFEDVVPHARPHEAWTAAVVRDDTTQVGRVLRDADPALPERIASLLDGTYSPSWLARAVSGPLDVDRFDYLLRDSHMTGVRYGAFDLDWLLHALRLEDAPDGEVVLAVDGRKGLPAVELYFLARRAMFEQVYFHKTSRAAEAMIGAIFRRVSVLVLDGREPEGLPPALARACRGEEVTTEAHLALDDGVLDTCFRRWTDGPDEPLADLCRRLAARALFKTVEPSPEEDPRALVDEARGVAERLGLDPDLYVHLDRAETVPYRVGAGLSDVWVSDGGGALVPLERASRVLAALGSVDHGRARLICAREIRDDLRGSARLVG